MKMLLVALAMLTSLSCFSQYYYKDVIGTREAGELLALYKANKVKQVSIKSFTVNNTPLDIVVQQEFFPEENALRTITKTQYTHPSYLTTFANSEGRIIKTIDSSAGAVNTTLYSYTADGKLKLVTINFGDSLAVIKTDDHIWQYDRDGKAKRMLRIKNKKDTAWVDLKVDEQGLVIEEQESRIFMEEPYYYYYDDQGRLTDIVRYNIKADRLLPEQMFEYSDKNQVVQKITIPQNSSQYLIWRYGYAENGLRMKEHIYNKEKELTGKVEYIYSFQ